MTARGEKESLSYLLVQAIDFKVSHPKELQSASRAAWHLAENVCSWQPPFSILDVAAWDGS